MEAAPCRAPSKPKMGATPSPLVAVAFSYNLRSETTLTFSLA
jgi:hypothetical protein